MPLQGGIFLGLQGEDDGEGAESARRRYVLHRRFLAAKNFQSTVARLRDFSSSYGLSWSRSAGLGGIQPVFESTREEQAVVSTVGRGLEAALYRSHGSTPVTFDEAFERAAGTIQAFYRGHRCRNSAWAAAVRIQAAYKGYRDRKRFLELKARVREAGAVYTNQRQFSVAAAVKIQAFYIGYRDRKLLNSLVAAAVKIQAFYRGYTDRKRFVQHAAAAATIQAFYRGHRARKQFILLQNAVTVKIQAVYRHRRRFFESRRLAVIIIQALYKGFRDRRQYLLQRSSAIKIQARVRQWISRRRQWYTTKCFVFTQAAVRGFLVRRTVQRWKVAAARIQYWWRKRLRRLRGQAGRTLAEDWNTVEVDRLEECLDTCLAGQPAGGSPGLPLEACSVQRKRATDEYKYRLQNETRLQQVARVFLLQHCISVQQQRARLAPPFPPQAQASASAYYSSLSSNERKIRVNYSEQQQHNSADLVLDVHCLENSVGKILVETAAATAGTKGLTSQLNTILVVFVAVVVYTRTVFHGVLLWAKQQNNPRNL